MDFKDLFFNLLLDFLLEWVSVVEVLSVIEEELGEDVWNEFEEMLEGWELFD